MSHPTHHKPELLIVDDDLSTRIALEALMTSHGYPVTCVESGEEALAAMKRAHYRIVISDWEMPGMTGPELCEQIRKMDAQGYTYFILLTSHGDQESIINGLKSGADDFVSKPYNPTELRVRVKNAERITTLDTMDMTIFALAKLAESRDPETGAHLDRVRVYAKLLAEDLQKTGFSEIIDDEFVRLIYATSPLHDIGKVSIPDCVLLKPGLLNDKEFEIMKSHTIAGAETIKAALDRYPNQRFLMLAHAITRSHHERFDGSGYPDGLKGEEIPLAARIMALADVYDALTSKRVYKDAMEHHVASQIIRDGAGTQFDPKVVMAYERIEHRFALIRAKFNQQPTKAA
jgi:cyclic di-GMP phosphodiesterase